MPAKEEVGLKLALRALTRIDGCSNSWDVSDACDMVINALNLFIDAKIRERELASDKMRETPQEVMDNITGRTK